METTRLSKHTISFGLSLALASLVNALLVVAKEKSPAVMAGMQKLTGHHWISHSAIVLVVFGLFGWLLSRPNGGRGIVLTPARLIGALVSGVALSGLIILGFYLIGD